MISNISIPRAVLTVLTLLRLKVPMSESVTHLSTRQRPAGPINMLPDVLDRHPDLSNYTSLMKRYPGILAHAGGYNGITLLAPTDAAFEKEPHFDFDNETEVVHLLEYHILPKEIHTDDLRAMDQQFIPTLLSNHSWTNVTGGQRLCILRQDEDKVVVVSGIATRSLLEYSDRDIQFFDGVIQPIDTLLVPPPRLAEVARTWFPSMSAFLGVLYKTGLADELVEVENVTIFAPENQAFQKTFGALDELSMAELRNVLAYHIVPNKVLYSNDLWDQLQIPTRATSDGEAEPVNVTVTMTGNNRYIDSSQIQDPDVLIANGVVHIISDVLNPLRPEAKADPTRKIQPAVFELKGSTATGRMVPTPYLSDLPCITDCPATQTPVQTHSRRPATLAAAAKCTGMPGAMGVVGMGMLAGIL